MQTVPATEQTQGHAEAVEDMFDAYYADKVIDLAEAHELRAAIRRTVRSADRANLSRAIDVCVIRGGFGGQRYQRLMKDWEDITDEPLDAA